MMDDGTVARPPLKKIHRNLLSGVFMSSRNLNILAILCFLFTAGCGYRFVDAYAATDYALVAVKNATEEAGLALLLEGELRKRGGFRENSGNRLSIVVTGFDETVESVSSSGTPVRQLLTMDIVWKVEGQTPDDVTSGRRTVSRSYPYSADPVTLDWNRSTAVRLLTEMTARSVLEDLRGQP